MPSSEQTQVEKKRIRDRRAQRNLRERRENYVKSLELKALACQQQHDKRTVEGLLDQVNTLKEQNESLRLQLSASPAVQVHPTGATSVQQSEIAFIAAGQNKLHDSCSNLSPPVETEGQFPTPCIDTRNPVHLAEAQFSTGKSVSMTHPDHAPVQFTLSPHTLSNNCNFSSKITPRTAMSSAEPSQISTLDACTEAVYRTMVDDGRTTAADRTPMSSEHSVISPARESTMSAQLSSPPATLDRDTDIPNANRDHLDLTSHVPDLVPAWMLVPMNDSVDSAVNQATCPWLANPELIVSSPDIPDPLALLHGSRRNKLADSIHSTLKKYNTREPELLAIGWLIYVFIKWRMRPTLEAYDRIPKFMRPVWGQLHIIHPWYLDLLAWPKLRVELFKYWDRYDFTALVGLLACCLKVRWKWGEDVLERNDNDELVIKQNFFDVFLSEGGWGLTEDFVKEFPELVKGLEFPAILVNLIDQ